MEDHYMNSNSEVVLSQPFQTPNNLRDGFVELKLRDDKTTRALKGKKHNRHLSIGARKQSKKHTSEAWEHFNKVIENGVATKAKCKYCTAVLTYRVNSGTSHLLKHARKVCPGKRLPSSGIGQTHLKIETETGGCNALELKEKEKATEFDQDISKELVSMVEELATEINQDISRKELVSMVARHEYPLSIVDHIGFKKFVKSLNSSFKMISRNTLKSDITKMYDEGRSSLKAMFEHNESRVAITTSVWTASNQQKCYLAVTSHYIDRQWILHNRTLRFCFVPSPQTASVLARVLMDSLSHYSLENKISSVVLDDTTTNDAMMSILMENLKSNLLMLGGSFLHLRCSAHILNLVVNDGLAVIAPTIEKVRDCIVFWMSTPKRMEKFDEACLLLNISSSRRLVSDCQTRWNSTYLMLQNALPFKDVFTTLKHLNRELKFVIPSEHDWMLVSLVAEKLEIFYKATKVLSGRNHPTSNLFFRKVCEIKLALKRWVQNDVETIRVMVKNMIEKFDIYWEHISGILAVATILDPRNKLDCVDYYFTRLYGDGAEKEVEKVRKNLDNLVVEYQRINEEKKSQELLSKWKNGIFENCDGEEDEYAQANKRTKKRKVNLRSEVEQYLNDVPIPEVDNFDVLDWWKRDQAYPTLKRIAKDILAIPVSSVDSKSAFSTNGGVVRSHRSKLRSQTVEALMCLQNWMFDDNKDTMDDIHSCSTVLEDSDEDEEQIDFIDMDVDGVEGSSNMEDLVLHDLRL